MEVPCGQCWSCRLARSREWATRIVKESMQWQPEESHFITLTYDDENLPTDHGLQKRHFQLFMKRVRKHYPNRKIKYFHCGEYGTACKNCHYSLFLHPQSESGQKYKGCNNYQEGLGRPHYHAIIFGIPFTDLEPLRITSSGELINSSQTLDRLWGKGFTSVGAVTFESAAYVARYIMKKITGDKADEHYTKEVIDKNTGEILTFRVQEEYITMSTRPAIGHEYLERYYVDMAKHDGVLLERQGNAFLVKPPKYFVRKLEELDKEKYDELKNDRLKARKLINKAEHTEERMLIKQKVKQIKTSRLTRQFEDYHNAN